MSIFLYQRSAFQNIWRRMIRFRHETSISNCKKISRAFQTKRTSLGYNEHGKNVITCMKILNIMEKPLSFHFHFPYILLGNFFMISFLLLACLLDLEYHLMIRRLSIRKMKYLFGENSKSVKIFLLPGEYLHNVFRTNIYRI